MKNVINLLGLFLLQPILLSGCMITRAVEKRAERVQTFDLQTAAVSEDHVYLQYDLIREETRHVPRCAIWDFKDLQVKTGKRIPIYGRATNVASMRRLMTVEIPLITETNTIDSLLQSNRAVMIMERRSSPYTELKYISADGRTNHVILFVPDANTYRGGLSEPFIPLAFFADVATFPAQAIVFPIFFFSGYYGTM